MEYNNVVTRCKINLDTDSDVARFVNIAAKLPGQIVVVDGEGLCVSARSILGMLYAMTFTELWCEADTDIYKHIESFVILE
jgi:hypothetical protein